jgi:diaminopimelate epimerase
MKAKSTKKAKPSRRVKRIPYAKLHGAGNDIIVVQSKDLPERGKVEVLKAMAHRQLGIGCDQIVEMISRKPLSVRMWNADGTTAEMCANGARVFLFLAAQEGWISKAAKEIPLRISGKPYVGYKAKSGYELCLGAPEVKMNQTLSIIGKDVPFQEVSVGNPHAVIFLGEGEGQWKVSEGFSVLVYGTHIENHPRFPKKTNVEFVRSWTKQGNTVKALVEVWERGAGATLSCGSGAVAVAGALRKMTGADRAEIQMTNYVLHVRFEGEQAYLSGPCALISKGWYFL